MDRPRIIVLLVDDQAFVGTVVARLLSTESGIEFHYCQSALDAVAFANRIVPSIILQDLVMPDIDGLTLVRSFRTNPQTATTPVVVLSANDDAATRTRALDAGAAGYLVKLPGRDDLVACIREAIAGAATPAADGSAAPPTVVQPGDDETLDRGVLEGYREDDSVGAADFVVDLIDDFIRYAGLQLDKLRDAARRADVPAQLVLAHSLKGSAMTVGAKKLVGFCGRMEDDLRKPDPAAATVLAEIEREFVCVREALAEERDSLRRG